jgi:hypothetical protein
MLRSELKTRRTWTDDARTLVLLSAVGIVGALGIAPLWYRLFHTDEPRTQGHAEVSGTQATQSFTLNGFTSVNLNAITTEGHPFTIAAASPAMDNPAMDNLTVVGDAYKHIAVFDPNSNRELATVHTQARAPHPFDARASTKIGDHITWDEKQRADFCATGCGGADECFAVVVVDGFNHVELDLPCVNGKVGTWQVTKLP